MTGEIDPLYVRARSALLDATDALAEQLDAIVLVGAQAVYLHTGDADLAVAEYTTDADLCVGPDMLADSPLLGDLLAAAGFTSGTQPGSWLSPDRITVDLMVPEALAGPGSRAARLGLHGKQVARRAKGLEGTLVDRAMMTIESLDPKDTRSVSMLVAGAGALLIAKTHKIADRTTAQSRIRDKDSLDIFRLLQRFDAAELALGISKLRDDSLSKAVTAEAVSLLPQLFGEIDSPGVEMLVRAAGIDGDRSVLAASITTLVAELLESL